MGKHTVMSAAAAAAQEAARRWPAAPPRQHPHLVPRDRQAGQEAGAEAHVVGWNVRGWRGRGTAPSLQQAGGGGRGRATAGQGGCRAIVAHIGGRRDGARRSQAGPGRGQGAGRRAVVPAGGQAPALSSLRPAPALAAMERGLRTGWRAPRGLMAPVDAGTDLQLLGRLFWAPRALVGFPAMQQVF